MTTKRTNKKAPQQPAKQSHYCDVIFAVEAVNLLFIRLGAASMDEWQINSILAGIFLPDDSDESPCSYFDFKNIDLAKLDIFLRKMGFVA